MDATWMIIYISTRQPDKYKTVASGIDDQGRLNCMVG